MSSDDLRAAKLLAAGCGAALALAAAAATLLAWRAGTLPGAGLAAADPEMPVAAAGWLASALLAGVLALREGGALLRLAGGRRGAAGPGTGTGLATRSIDGGPLADYEALRADFNGALAGLREMVQAAGDPAVRPELRTVAAGPDGLRAPPSAAARPIRA